LRWYGPLVEGVTARLWDVLQTRNGGEGVTLKSIDGGGIMSMPFEEFDAWFEPRWI